MRRAMSRFDRCRQIEHDIAYTARERDIALNMIRLAERGEVAHSPEWLRAYAAGRDAKIGNLRKWLAEERAA